MTCDDTDDSLTPVVQWLWRLRVPYTPLDSQSVFSTAFMEGPLPWAVWTAILATADSDGVTAINPPLLARIWRIPIEQVQGAWDVHTHPDPLSKNKEHEGRRIIPTKEGRWFVVGHKLYREMYSKEKRADGLREAKRRQRAKEAGLNVECSKCHGWVTNPGDEYCSACSFSESLK